jgi:hypothetical protein
MPDLLQHVRSPAVAFPPDSISSPSEMVTGGQTIMETTGYLGRLGHGRVHGQ